MFVDKETLALARAMVHSDTWVGSKAAARIIDGLKIPCDNVQMYVMNTVKEDAGKVLDDVVDLLMMGHMHQLIWRRCEEACTWGCQQSMVDVKELMHRHPEFSELYELAMVCQALDIDHTQLIEVCMSDEDVYVKLDGHNIIWDTEPFAGAHTSEGWHAMQIAAALTKDWTAADHARAELRLTLNEAVKKMEKQVVIMAEALERGEDNETALARALETLPREERDDNAIIDALVIAHKSVKRRSGS